MNFSATAIVHNAVNQTVYQKGFGGSDAWLKWMEPRGIDEEIGRRTFARTAGARFILLGVDRGMQFENQREGRKLPSRQPRIEAGFVVRVRCSLGDFPARITNLSSRGFRLHSARPLEAGWEISLEVPKRPPVRCLVRWSTGTEAGGVFTEPVAL